METIAEKKNVLSTHQLNPLLIIPIDFLSANTTHCQIRILAEKNHVSGVICIDKVR